MFPSFHFCSMLSAAVLTVSTVSIAQSEGDTPALETEKAKISYSLGVQFGKALQYSNDRIDMEILKRGMDDVAAGRDLAMDDASLGQFLMEFQQTLQQDRENALVTGGEEFLDANAKKDGVVVLDSGLQYKVIRPGTGASPKATDTVETHYRGTFTDGKEFDSSYSRGESSSFPVNRVIPGWTEALQLMKEGAKWELYIPSDLAYGSQGRQGIPAYSTLLFELELIRIVK